MKNSYGHILVLIFLSGLLFFSCSEKNKGGEENTSKDKSKVPSVSEIYDNAKNSIVVITSNDFSNTPLKMGSGFYFRDNLIATNFHVIDGAHFFKIKNVGSKKEFSDVKVRSYSKDSDIAILEVQEKSEPLKLAIAEDLKIGQSIVAIGNPNGLEGSVSTGIISGVRDFNNYNALQITAPISSGSSGGPVFNDIGEVIGLATFTLEHSQNLNFAMPIKAVLELENLKIKWEPKKIKIISDKNSNSGLHLTYYDKIGPEFYEIFSIKNDNGFNISNIVAVFIYKSMTGEIIDYQIVELNETVPAKLAKKFTIRSFDQDQKFVFYQTKDFSKQFYRSFKYDFRILSYEVIE